ncbi:MAG: ABC transporter ATP-binding protein [Acidimicrobiales bacterium]|nr:ABC transporter ATP-binding protein [Acidimicrobiales bacterium]
MSVRNLVKSYGRLTAVDGVSFAIEPGEVFALLGPNGAGKSTTIEILEGFRDRTSGSVEVLGVDPAGGGRALRDRIGVVLQQTGIELELTVREALEQYGAAYRSRRPADELVELVGLDAKADERITTLSGGQKRRVDLALGLVGDPDIVFLDEPTTGFDPSARRESWELIDRLAALGKTILLTTHYLDEAQHLADRVAVLQSGRIIAEGTPQELTAQSPTRTVISFGPTPAIDATLAELGDRVRRTGQRIEVETESPTADLALITTAAANQNIELPALQVSRPSLEDVYLELLGPAE